jgi:antirestriction protein ArdC
MNTQTTTNTQETQVATQAKHYRKTVVEMYQEAVEKVVDSKKSAAQVSASGNEFQGLNKAILNEAKAELGYKSNKWYTKKQMDEANLVPKSEDDYGVILFSSKLKDIEGSNKKEKIITYYRVFNEDSLEELPI